MEIIVQEENIYKHKWEVQKKGDKLTITPQRNNKTNICYKLLNGSFLGTS